MISSYELVFVKRPKLFNIVAPVGAFGNHLRWLILLSQEFDFTHAAKLQHFDSVKGPSWPSYSDYLAGNIPNSFVDEINTMAPRISFDRDRQTFMLDRVYNDTRSFNNWLDKEWQWRSALDSILPLTHNATTNQIPTILIVGDPELCLKTYSVFNPKLVGYQPSEFIKYIQECNQKNLNVLQNCDCYQVSSDQLYTDVLDVALYRNITSWMNITPTEALAQEVHGAWFQAHQRSQRDYCQKYLP